MFEILEHLKYLKTVIDHCPRYKGYVIHPSVLDIKLLLHFL